MIQSILNKEVAILSSIATVLVATISGAFLIDQRYAHAAELEKLKKEQSQIVRQIRQSAVEDKVFDLQSKENRTVAEEAQLKRYERELNKLLQESNNVKTGT